MGALFGIRSDKDTHFTTALATNAIDIEVLGDLDRFSANRLPSLAVKICRISLWSDQNLAWDVALFRTSAGQPNADLDLDTMTDWVRFSASDAMQIAGAGAFRYTASGLFMVFDSSRSTGQINVGLINRDAVAKIAGALGEVVIEIEGEVL
jgi:hypothetical protein